MQNTPTVLHSGIALTNRQMATIRSTIAADTNPEEFELFIEVCKRTGLDPFMKHVFPLVFGKNDASKRRMSIVVAQAGLRLLADRTRDYRPDENEPVYTYTDDTLTRTEELHKCKEIEDLDVRKARIQKINEVYPIDPANPAGVLKVNVTLWKMDVQGRWHPVSGVAYWNEFAPVRKEAAEYEWVDTGEVYADSGKPKKRKKAIGALSLVLDSSGNWPKMPLLMIAKCATMQALRAGWPSVYGGLYDEAEVDKMRTADRSAMEAVEEFQQQQRAAIAGAKNDEYPTVSADGTLAFVPAGRLVDHFLAEARGYKTVATFDAMMTRNRECFTRFWAMHKDDALQLKAALEAARDKLRTVQVAAAPTTEVPLPDPLVTDETPPTDSKERFMAAELARIETFRTADQVLDWWNATSLQAAIIAFELTKEETAKLRMAGARRKAIVS